MTLYKSTTTLYKTLLTCFPQISDLSFRRYVLVQAMIIMDFLLSHTAEARQKLSSLKQPNKSVTYPDHILSPEDVRLLCSHFSAFPSPHWRLSNKHTFSLGHLGYRYKIHDYGVSKRRP